MTSEDSASSLVVIALDAEELTDYAIELARSVARDDSPELLGLFVESSELLAVAGSRHAREFMLTGSERALDRDAVERQLRLQAQRARSRFETATARLGLRHRFEVARGSVVSEPVRRAAAAQALVVSLANSAAAPASIRGLLREILEAGLPRVLFARHGWVTGQSVAVIVDELTPATRTALEAAAAVATASRSPLVVLAPAADAANRAELRAGIRKQLEGLVPGPSHIIELMHNTTDCIVRAARACRARLLVMPTPADAGDVAALGELMRRYLGALMLVKP